MNKIMRIKCNDCNGSGRTFEGVLSANGQVDHVMRLCHCYDTVKHGETPKPTPPPKKEIKCDGDDGCGNWYHEDKWIDTEIGCHDCGSHFAYRCPNEDCQEVYDSVWDDRETRKVAK